MDRTAWAWMPVLALPFAWVEPTPCSAQAPSPPTMTAAGADPDQGRAVQGLPPLPQPATPAAEVAVQDRGSRELPPALPSSTPPTSSRSGMIGSGSPNVNPLARNLTFKPAPTMPNDLRFPINLATALRLSDARPLVVAAAQASVWVAEAELTHAKVLWVPTLNIGFDYVRHDGGGPDFNKGIMTAPSVNFFYAGAGLTGNGLIGNIPTADAIFEPLVARQVLNSRQWDVQTSKNDVLLQTANAYFAVHQARGTYAGNLYTVERGRDLVRRIEQLSGELVTKVEIERARNFLADLEQLAATSRQEWRVQSANLTQVLRLDPRAVVEPLEHDHAQITLIDPGQTLDELMPIALTNRPEARLARGAGPGRSASDPPGEGEAARPQRAAQRLPDSRRVDSGRDLRPWSQHQAESVARSRRLQHSASLAAGIHGDRQSSPDQGTTRARNRNRSSSSTRLRTQWRRT